MSFNLPEKPSELLKLALRDLKANRFKDAANFLRK